LSQTVSSYSEVTQVRVAEGGKTGHLVFAAHKFPFPVPGTCPKLSTICLHFSLVYKRTGTQLSYGEKINLAIERGKPVTVCTERQCLACLSCQLRLLYTPRGYKRERDIRACGLDASEVLEGRTEGIRGHDAQQLALLIYLYLGIYARRTLRPVAPFPIQEQERQGARKEPRVRRRRLALQRASLRARVGARLRGSG